MKAAALVAISRIIVGPRLMSRNTAPPTTTVRAIPTVILAVFGIPAAYHDAGLAAISAAPAAQSPR
jgi:multisubunit Na+/H+ antiporter MnhF subunit